LESRNIQVIRRFQPGVEASIVPHELRQILTNLISNSVDALTVPGPILAVQIAAGPESTRLIIEDNGRGIPPSALDRIFEPFFTTKHNVGTGIGLWVTRELVQSNGGRIHAESGDLLDGMRTRFQIEFPRA
jgi:signal transduction histidine kinase